MNNSSDPLVDIKIPHAPKTQRAVWFGILIIALFMGSFFVWALITPLESAAVTPGKVIVAGNRRSVQHLEGGIVKAIYVKEGSKVKKGEPLIQLDDTRAKIVWQLHRSEVIELMAIEARLISERDGATTITFPSRFIQRKDNKKVTAIMNSQNAIFQADRLAFAEEINILKQRINLLKEQIKGAQVQLKATHTQIKYIDEETRAVAYLEAKKLIDRPRLLALLRAAARLNGQKGELISKISSLQQSIGETKLQISAKIKGRRKEILTQLRETQQKLADALEKEKAAEDLLKRTTIRSPQSGIVMGLKIHTIGGVIKPSETIMDIVPNQEELIIEARISPTDIDVVHNGLIAKVQLTAFKLRVTPILLGQVTHISADAFTDDKTSESYYTARIAIDPTELKQLPKGQELYPGMPVQVMIITAKLTPWQYFIAPITRSFQRAFREQ